MRATLNRHKFTVDEYDQMIATGVIPEGSRYELIEGEIIEMAAMGGRHFSRVLRLNRRFSRLLGEFAFVSIQSAIRISPRSEPEPDVALLRPRDDEYQSVLPEPADTLLIVEVSDTTLRVDRTTKIGLYARAGIAESWMLALPEDCLLVYRDPSPDGYRTVLTLRRGDTVAPLAFPDVRFDVADLLGRPEPVRGEQEGQS